MSLLVIVCFSHEYTEYCPCSKPCTRPRDIIQLKFKLSIQGTFNFVATLTKRDQIRVLRYCLHEIQCEPSMLSWREMLSQEVAAPQIGTAGWNSTVLLLSFPTN